MSSFDDQSLIQEFVTESNEHLESIEPDLLTLEQEGGQVSQDIVNRIFRAIHSIKGASGFFGFENLKNLSHVMESVLMLIRDGKLTPTPEVVQPMLTGVDKLRNMLEDITASEEVDCQEQITALNAILSGEPPSKADSGKKKENKKAEDTSPSENRMEKISVHPLFEPERMALDAAVAHGQKLFSVEIYMDQDLKDKNRTPLDLLDVLTSTGVVLDSAFNLEGFAGLDSCLDTNLSVVFLYASVLDIDLIAAALNIPETQVGTIDLSEILGGEKKSTTPQAPTKQAEKKADTEDKTENSTATPVKQPARKAEGGGGGDSGAETVRVKVDLLNRLMDLAGELVLSRNQLMRTMGRELAHVEGLSNIAQNIDLVTSDLQEHIMQTRMQAVGNIFRKFPRVVRDISHQLGKEIELITTGEDVELDKSILESLSDPLTHLIRNCCDHGIETPEVRQQSGKGPKGTVLLEAYHEGGQINIRISDDGKGIDHKALAKKALDNGMLTEAALSKMSPQEMANLIFMPGLSTAKEISDISGRGVGMDVVRTNIEKLGGNITLTTELGQGTTLILRLPLTLAIIPSLVVGVEGHRFAMPQINLVELVRVKASEIASKVEKVGSASVLRLRGKLLPLVRLADVLGLQRTYEDPYSQLMQPDRRETLTDDRVETEPRPDETPENRREHYQSDYNILVLKVGANQYGLIVDEVYDTEEIVVKPLSTYLKECKCFSGATIMGDGRVAMILDAGGIATFSKLSFSEVEAEEQRRLKEQIDNVHSELAKQRRQSVILFNNAPDEVFAIPLSSLLRLERFQIADIEKVGNKEFLTYRGKGLPLLRLENYLPVRPVTNDLEEAFLIIPKTGDGAAGIVVSKIIDTVEINVDLEQLFDEQEGIRGSAIINDHMTVFIDPDQLLAKAHIHLEEANLSC